MCVLNEVRIHKRCATNASHVMQIFEINMWKYLIHLIHFSATYYQLGFCVVMDKTIYHCQYYNLELDLNITILDFPRF